LQALISFKTDERPVEVSFDHCGFQPGKLQVDLALQLRREE
jgi:hypothetical protein